MQRQDNGPLMDAIIPYIKQQIGEYFSVQVGKLSFSRENFVFKCVDKNLFLVHIKIARTFLFPVHQLLSIYD